ncbi:hypothetical protein OIV83_006250 [Microbotryomycetes sp. JL201]|nr:hypothetical protein OIV83_006250 [Microbotryomycetes sp. JL201]
MTSEWPTFDSCGRLSRADAVRYLERIRVPAAVVDCEPSLELLTRLQSQHIFNVPFETTAVHIPDLDDDDARINLGQGPGVTLGRDAFETIVMRKRGGYCFSLNSTFALLLRYFGFRVSEMAARVYKYLGEDPLDKGWDWHATSHQCAIVDWEGSDQRYFVDVGFGSAQSLYPIPFQHGSEQTSFPKHERFRLDRHDRLPIQVAWPVADPQPAWILSHLEYPRGDAKGTPRPPYWSPVYAFVHSTVSYNDFVVYNHYNSTFPGATFVNFFVVTQLQHTGERLTLSFSEKTAEPSSNGTPKRVAKLSRTGGQADPGDEARLRDQRDVQWVDMNVRAVKAVLKENFGFEFA